MPPKKQDGGSDFAALEAALDEQNKITKSIYELLQGKMGEKGMVHKLNDVHDTIQLHKMEIENAKTERGAIKGDVVELQKKQFRLAAIMSAIGLGGGMTGGKIIEKIAQIFGGGNGGN